MKKSLGALLLEKDVITSDQWEEVQREEKNTGYSFQKVLIQLNIIEEKELVNFISKEMDVPRIELNNYLIDQKLIDLVPEDLARKHQLIPALKIGSNLTCAMVDVFNIFALDEIMIKTGLSIEPAVSTQEEIDKALNTYYSIKGNMEDVFKDIDEQKFGIKEGEDIDSKQLENMGGEPPVVKLVNMMTTQAVHLGASDIHIQPEEEQLKIRFRIDGVLHEQSSPPKHFQAAIISRIKILAELNISERRRPQDGRFHMKMENRQIDIRVSVMPTVHGENVVMRLLDTSNILLGLEEIGLRNETLSGYKELIKKTTGIILVTGPTGSGKTSTLYSSLKTIHTPEKGIVTIEDPVEYRLSGIRQVQVDAQVDLTFSNGLRSILRQDPDIIMVGEIRDVQTAQIAIQAALTGHLVFATLHTNNAAGAITRLMDIGVEPFLLSSAVIGVLAQRLIRTFCKDCQGKGCSACFNTGYKGRSGIYELMVMNTQIRTLVLEKSSTDKIYQAALDSGMKSLREDGLEKSKKGITSKEEIFRVTQE